MDASDQPAITFYDILLDPKAYPGAPNPWKTRYALNLANVPYRTKWVPFPDVAKTREALNIPISRKNLDGSDFPTLPIISDPLVSPEKGEVIVGDSFDIALHLQQTYLSSPSSPSPNPGKGQLFPPNTVALHRAFNKFVDELFTIHGVALAGFHMPFDPRTAESDREASLRRAPGNMKWSDIEFPQGSEPRISMLKGLEEVLDTKLSPCFPGTGETNGHGGTAGNGPFMDGNDTPMYADFIVGGWLQFMRQCLPEWEDLRGKWSGGKWGRLFDALEEWAAVDGREGVAPKRR